MSRDILSRLSAAVIKGDEKSAIEEAKLSLELGVDPFEAITKGLSEGLNVVGKLYELQRYFLPEIIMSARAMKAGLAILKPHIKVRADDIRARIVIGTVAGDIHDIGKNLVVTLFQAANFEVEDLGVNVALDRFVEKAEAMEADVIGLSALMATSMPRMKDLIDILEKEDLRAKYKVIIGGAPVTQAYADRIKADGYGPNAVKAIDLVKNFHFSPK